MEFCLRPLNSAEQAVDWALNRGTAGPERCEPGDADQHHPAGTEFGVHGYPTALQQIPYDPAPLLGIRAVEADAQFTGDIADGPHRPHTVARLVDPR